MKKALLCGVFEQDGAYVKLLSGKFYAVYGGSRDAQMATFGNLSRLSIREQVKQVSISINDFRGSLQAILKIRSEEIYNLVSQTLVGLSFEQLAETVESISPGTLNLLESIRLSDLPIRFYSAISTEYFRDTGHLVVEETTLFRLRTPYRVAKSVASWQVANHGKVYQVHAITRILFNHESLLRPKRFVTQKLIATAYRIANGVARASAD